MALKLIGINNQGDATLEFVHLVAETDCELCFSMVADSTYTSPGHMSNRLRHHYWWAEGETAKAGDNIFLFTGIGKDDVMVHNGVIARLYYWNLKSPVWNDTGDKAVLFELNGWSSCATPAASLRLAA
jgi:hypothetical protein